MGGELRRVVRNDFLAVKGIVANAFENDSRKIEPLAMRSVEAEQQGMILPVPRDGKIPDAAGCIHAEGAIEKFIGMDDRRERIADR